MHTKLGKKFKHSIKSSKSLHNFNLPSRTFENTEEAIMVYKMLHIGTKRIVVVPKGNQSFLQHHPLHLTFSVCTEQT